MKRDDIRSHVDQAIDALAANRQMDAMAILRSLQVALQPKVTNAEPAPDAATLEQLQDALDRATAGNCDAAEVVALVDGLALRPAAEVVALARAFGCTWLPLRATRKAALRAVSDTLLAPIEAAERAGF